MIAIVDYSVGNVKSVLNMLKKIGVEAQLSSDKDFIKNSSHIILPGVGAFDYGVKKLQESGLFDLIKQLAFENKKILGICLGAQLLGNLSQEGKLSGLGLIDMNIVKFNKANMANNLKIPHMGWANIQLKQNNFLFNKLAEDNDTRFYFVHSYHFELNNPTQLLATANYGYEFACVVKQNNVIGAQFHPEKSHKFGMQLLKNFSEM